MGTLVCVRRRQVALEKRRQVCALHIKLIYSCELVFIRGSFQNSTSPALLRFYMLWVVLVSSLTRLARVFFFGNVPTPDSVNPGSKRLTIMHHPVFHKAAVAALAILCSVGAWQQASAQLTNPPAVHKPGEKDVLLPARIGRVPDGNDFNNPESEFAFKRSKATPHFVLFWSKEYGDDPMNNSVTNRRFNVDEVLAEADRFYEFFVDKLKWVDKEKSFATKYKFLIFVIGGTGGTAFGGSIDNKIGAFWTPATRIHRGPYGVVAHELGHSFQALVRADGAASFSGPNLGEMTSQYMLWQVYPEWMTFENYHLNDWMKATHLYFTHGDNQYHSAQVLEYWSGKHGIELIGKMWREVQRPEDVIMTYKRLTGITQEQFNDEIFDAARRFVTWDMARIEKVAAQYANQHFTTVTKTSDGWYQIATNKCPQNYGYNALKLKVPPAGTKVSLDFKSLVGSADFPTIRPENAGWRYGFLASKEDGSRVYSDVYSKPGTAEFTVPANTKYLWFVVSGAPTEHWTPVSQRRGGGGGGGRRGATNTTATVTSTTTNAGGAVTTTTATATTTTTTSATADATPAPAVTIAQWPYAFKLTGTTPDDSMVN
jgi:hypothetical protein